MVRLWGADGCTTGNRIYAFSCKESIAAPRSVAVALAGDLRSFSKDVDGVKDPRPTNGAADRASEAKDMLKKLAAGITLLWGTSASCRGGRAVGSSCWSRAPPPLSTIVARIERARAGPLHARAHHHPCSHSCI